jgi:hypothetical protein
MKKLLFILTAVISLPAFAIDLLPQDSPGMHRRVRNLGMGNVGAATPGTHDSAAFYNPAGLADLTEGEVRFMNLTFEVAKNSFDLPNDVKDFADDIDDAPNNADKVRELNDFIQARSGEFQHFRMGIELLSYTRKNFAAGLLLDERLDLSFRDQSFPHFDIRNIGDVSAYVAMSQGFFDQLLQVGMAFFPTMRFALNEDDQQVTYADVTTENSKGDPILIDQLKNIYKDRQFVIPVNFGLKSNLAFDFLKDTYFLDALKPQVGVTWDAVGSPSFAPSVSMGQTVNAGMSINPEFLGLKNTFAIEMREINRERPLLTKTHVGAEFKFPYIIAFRGGVSQGYWTAGTTLDFKFVKIDGAIYSEEVGYSTRQDGNLRYAATFGFKI